MILVCYDGSDDARAAVDGAGKLLARQQATVLTVWQPFVQVLAASATGLGAMAGLTHMEEIDEASRKQAERHATGGAKLARAAGLEATPRACSQDTTTAEAILSQAEAVDVEAIVMGSRGLTGLKSLLLGSVSHAVIQQADRTVIVVPSAEVAAARAARLVASEG